MQKITVICVGKLKELFFQNAAAEYAKRLRRFCVLDLIELPEERTPENPSPGQIDAALAREAEAIRAKLPPGAFVVALCIEGKAIPSEALSALLTERAAIGGGQVAFILGGSFGLHPAVKAMATVRLSMSPMTFPHHLARVMLLEQLYRAYQIAAGGKYHK